MSRDTELMAIESQLRAAIRDCVNHTSRKPCSTLQLPRQIQRIFALSLNNLAKLYYLQELYVEAEPLYLQALEIFEQQLGVNHPWTVKCGENLANLRDRLPPPQ